MTSHLSISKLIDVFSYFFIRSIFLNFLESVTQKFGEMKGNGLTVMNPKIPGFTTVILIKGAVKWYWNLIRSNQVSINFLFFVLWFIANQPSWYGYNGKSLFMFKRWQQFQSFSKNLFFTIFHADAHGGIKFEKTSTTKTSSKCLNIFWTDEK